MTENQEAARVPAETVYDFVERVLLQAGVEESSAKLTARGLWLASLRGVDSHGLRLLPHYLKAVQGGRINPRPDFSFERTSPSTGRLDADHGFGHAAGIRAMRHAIDLASEAGSGHVAVRNSSHSGSMAYFAFEACKHDMIGTAYTHGTPKMRTPNATTTFLGTNPVCLAAPMASEGPFCYDGSTTQISANKIRFYGEHGLELPPLCGADQNGNETRVPAEVVQLLPMGDYKGFGIAMIVDILCGLLSGMPMGEDVSDMFNDPFSEKRLLGQFYGALRIDVFEEPDRFKARLQDMADRIRRQPRRDPDTPVQVAGDPEKAFQADREANGIPIMQRELAQFASVAEELGVEPLPGLD
ncbi:MAG: Ldh family oxidoreductase [Gemmatimonadota bacterium]|nr:MAG: Ldh family oxidoreductase [Gemmatimonadota bacterium]